MSPYQGKGVWKDTNIDYMPLRLVKLRMCQFGKAYETLSDLADGNKNFAEQLIINAKTETQKKVAQLHAEQGKFYERVANWNHRVAKLYWDALEERTANLPMKVSFT